MKIQNNLSTSLIIKALGFSPELLQNKISVIESLLNDLNENIITADDVSEQLDQEKTKTYHKDADGKIHRAGKSVTQIWL